MDQVAHRIYWRNTLDLEPVTLSEGPCLTETIQIPFIYCRSPDLIPKPADWGNHIGTSIPNVPSILFFREAPSYAPPNSLEAFLNGGTLPIYIGFGSIVVEDNEKTTAMVLEAVRLTGLGSTDFENDNVYYIDDCPHEWLFQKVAAVVHHGGTGTTACGLRYGCPTTIIPFFGDQPFWEDMVAAAHVGPKPIPYKLLTADGLATAIRFCLSKEVVESARVIAKKLHASSGVKDAVRSFHAQLLLEQLRCDVLSDQPAHLKIDRKKLMLSVRLAYTIGTARSLIVIRHSLHELLIKNQRWDPVTGTTSVAIATYYRMSSSIANIFIKPAQIYRASIKAVSKQKTEPHSGVPVSPKPNVAASMALASASSLGRFFHHYSKGVMVDLPLAFAEGSRMLPKLLGDEVPDYGTGFAGLVIKPYTGVKNHGVLGGALGIGQGVLDFSTKVSTGEVYRASYAPLWAHEAG
ncbi:hypothetical protein BKA67DRAFT_592773 [Truncatella angustata]|uniref:Erythromycin biosynthesis protein CIII-like C-terminal domain-containing protein n=1 Tax=Truncatella angustata TaxID=152316 RepID=A0A9P8UMG7_9PEZI|nr:uncharacterized protein BKA67DRAFT_592773 [Truncatella angustata]KAH6654803.1 hypothetical protein BKA67DRAFT_592773 [Truncatella angustata]